VRVPSSNPTWIVRLDARHMAFLKDHKVENHVIFPAAAFVEMALEAGTQLFEGRPFVVEDFEIRKPLILPEPASGVQLEFSFSPNERTFSIQSRFEQSVSWSLHVVGSLRGERTESNFALSEWEPSSKTQPLLVDDFYKHLSDLGLRYGNEFRALRELSAGAGESAGRVALSEAIAPRASEYALHPVLLDGALHVFSAAATTVEDRHARMKLPVRFGRILFLGSPGASSRVSAIVRAFGDDFLEGDIALYNEHGKPCVQVDGFRAISLSGTARSAAPAGTRDLTYHVAWERTPSDSSRTALTPLPLTELRAVAQEGLDRVVAIRGASELETALVDADELAAAQIARGLREMGVTSKVSFDSTTLRVGTAMQRAFARLTFGLVRRKLLKKTSAGWRTTKAFDRAADSAEKILRAFLEKHP